VDDAAVGIGAFVTTRRTRSDWSATAPFRFAVGIEDTFIPQERVGLRRLDEYELTQHYQFWREDLDLVARSGADSLRWGIPWYRVEPDPGRFEWDWVDRVVDYIAELGLTCIVDLMHYGTPLWMTDSFLDPDYPARVAAYAAAAASRYGDRLDVWTPLNEPNVNADFCGQRGVWPPYRTGEEGFVALTVPLAEGIAATQRAIRDVQPDASFVYVEASFRYTGDRFPIPRDVLDERRFVVLDLALGRVGADHPMRTWLLRHGADPERLERLMDDPVVPDVLGVNYYPAFSTVCFDDSGSQVGVETGTDGLNDVVRTYAARYGLPLMITETSRGGALDDRRTWLHESLAAIASLRAEGVPLVGYTWFPFTALIDWAYREATSPIDDWIVQMGMVDLRRVPGGGALERQPTALLDDFAAAARQRTLAK
jgi:beta-glucosidase/6-phospho-beta-glucosidase/beta-galactosidase